MITFNEFLNKKTRNLAAIGLMGASALGCGSGEKPAKKTKDRSQNNLLQQINQELSAQKLGTSPKLNTTRYKENNDFVKFSEWVKTRSKLQS